MASAGSQRQEDETQGNRAPGFTGGRQGGQLPDEAGFAAIKHIDPGQEMSSSERRAGCAPRQPERDARSPSSPAGPAAL